MKVKKFKGIIIFSLLFIFLLQGCLVSEVFAQAWSDIRIFTVSSDEALQNCGYPFKRKCFHAEGMEWAFYVGWSDYYLRYKTSADNGSTWDTGLSSPIYESSVSMIDVDMCFNGIYVYFVVNNNYRRGIPNVNGSITFAYDWQAIGSGIARASIATDSSGLPFVGYWNTSDDKPYVIKSSTASSWTTASGYPYSLSTTVNADWRVLVLPMLSGKMYAAYSNPTNGAKGKLLDGIWGSEETITSNIVRGWLMCGVNFADVIHFGYLSTGNSSKSLCHRYRENGTWSSEVVLGQAPYWDDLNNNGGCPTFSSRADGLIHVYYAISGSTYQDIVRRIWVDDYDFWGGESIVCDEPRLVRLYAVNPAYQCWYGVIDLVFTRIISDSSWAISFPQPIETGVSDGYPPGAGHLITGWIYVNGITNWDLTFTMNGTVLQTNYGSYFQTGTYLLNATPYYEGYIFINWTDPPGATFDDPYSPVTNVTITESGTITLYLETEASTVKIYIRVNGYAPYTDLTFTIGSVPYKNCDSVILYYGNVYSLNGTPAPFFSFINWTATGCASVSNSSNPIANLTVTVGSGTLTQYLNATILNVSSSPEIHAGFAIINTTYTSQNLSVNGVVFQTEEIYKNGSSPYLDAVDGITNCVFTTSTSAKWDQYYTFEDTSLFNITDAKIWICLQQPDGDPIYAYAQVYLWNGSSYVGIAGFQRIGTWTNMSYNIMSFGFDTPSKIDNARLKLGLYCSHYGYVAYVTAVWLEVYGYEISDVIYYQTPQTFYYDEETAITLMANSTHEGYIFQYWLIDSETYETEIVNLTITETMIATIYYELEATLWMTWIKQHFNFFFGIGGYLAMAIGTVMFVRELKDKHDIQKALFWILIIVPVGFAFVVMWLFT